MKTLSTSLITSAAAVGLLVAAQATVAAKPSQPLPPPDYDSKTYRAASCQARPADVWRYEFGGIYNPSDSSTDVEVVCPIVRDNVKNEDGVMIWVNFGALGEPIECKATSWSSTVIEIDEVIDYGFGAFNWLLLWLEESTSGGSYSLSCTLPPDSMILSYKVREPEGSLDNTTDYNR